MKFNKVAVIGLGLIGGSIASGLKASGNVKEVIGIDNDNKTIEYGVSNNIIDKGFTKLDESIKDSDIVIIATYVDTIPAVAKELATIVSAETVITDVGSVKGSIVEKIEKSNLEDFNFIGSHPIAGKEYSGVKYSDKDLFSDKICIITPNENSDKKAVQRVSDLWDIAGCNVIKLEPKLHDFIFSNVSHLPHVVAYSLIKTVATADSDLNLFNYAGGGLNDFTRIAASSPEMWTTIFSENKDALLESIKRFRNNVEEIEKAIESEDRDELLKILSHSQYLKNSF